MGKDEVWKVVGLSLDDANNLKEWLLTETETEGLRANSLPKQAMIEVVLKTEVETPRGLSSPIPPEVLILMKNAFLIGLATGAGKTAGSWLMEKIREWAKSHPAAKPSLHPEKQE